MKKLFTLLLVLLASMEILQAEVYSGTCGENLTWSLDTETGVMSIKGNGAMDDWNYAESPWIDYHSYINVISLPEGLTNIGDRAFQFCENLTSVSIPSTVQSIGDGAFNDCRSLTSATIPYGVTTIGSSAFGTCDNLSSVTIPNSVATIGDFAFDGSAISSITIPNSVERIGEHAFYLCSNLKSVNILGGDIGYQAFKQCEKMEFLSIGNNVSNIGEYSFSFCSNLTSIDISNSVTSIGDGAFYSCSNLSFIRNRAEIPQIIEDNVFIGVNKSTCLLIVPDESYQLYKNASVWHEFLKDSSTLICIAGYGMCGEGLGWTVSCDSSVLTITGIGDMTNFEYDGAPWYKFKDSLEYVFLPKGITSIGDYAFNGCSNIKEMTSNAITPPACGASVFRDINKNIPLKLPEASIDLYKIADQWEEFFPNESIESNQITIRLDPQSCADWSVVRLWAWTSNGNLFDAWPGIVVSPDADGWYSYTFDESVESVNIIWTDGTNQTVNIEGVTASTCYALNSTSGKTITASVVDCGSTASNYYTIRFLNWDGTVLQNSQVKEGELPSYTGTTPVRPADEQYTYSFSGWSPAIATATADVDYTAQFTATEKTTDPSIPTVQDLATAGYDVANKVVLCLYFDDAPCYDVVIAGTYKADEAGSWITDPEQLVHMAALESFEGWYAAEIPYSSNAQGKPIQLKSNGAFSWEYQSGDADAWTNKGGAGSQTAAIVAGYNNEADVYYPAPGCYIYELAYWKNHNNPCVIIPTHNYTIHLYAPDACEEMKPAIIGNFNNWNTGVPMSETTDEQGKKMYTITIADEEGKTFKFRDAAYDNWSNELQEYLEEYKLWATFSNFVLPAVTADTTIVFDFSDNSRYRFRLCEKTEDVVVWLKVPTGAPGYYNGAIEMVVYSADEPTAMPLQYNQEDELWSVELQAKGSNYFFVMEANSEDNYILNYTHYYYSDGSDEYVWSTWGTTFQYYWEDGTGNFTGSKIIMLDISNPSYYKWAVPAIGTGIEDIQGDDVQCTKVLRDGQIFILRGDKTYTLQGQEVK